MSLVALDALSSTTVLPVLASGVSELLASGGLPSIWPDFGWLSTAVETATGWFGLAIIFVYSFLIAFALPGVSEIVLFAPLELGLSNTARLALIMFVSGVGKAAGSVFAFHIGQEAKSSGFVERRLRRSRFDVMEWTERKTLEIAQKWGYAGLAAALCVPGFPDTLSIYAFSVLEEDYLKFALATFVGSVGRLVFTVVTLSGVGVTF
ncbi:membrane protein YqaA, SNARE-associated domain [Halogeometricum rufum]|uniref:Membrane protein YqaA, SNARE-associated domain n=1 Tax=Halogeometricum rufum TaxID=553469 RepID=A0A1I6GF95_9EURY|nr:VTT domain-containing protein [Halogeometricum rufum]SFR40874.1 membrane protein YqaA, SNARE-associated domain [Halogeometricum rufum]